MKRIIAIAMGLVIISSTAAVAETKFTPLNFDNNTTANTTEQKGPVMLDPSQVTGGTKMQSAILQLDNAQIEVRNQLLNYRADYTEIDGKYKATKEERKAAKKKIKQAEKRIKNLDKAKTKIRKNFEQKINM